jgi:ribosomal protein L37AE/L43A
MDNLYRAPGVDGAGGKPLHLCPNCSAYIIAATWSERVSERCVRNVWSCESCSFEFETSAYFAAEQTANRSGH